MSILGKIISVIFGSPANAAPGSIGKPAGTIVPGSTNATAEVDVNAVVSRLAEQKKEKLDWRKSIVDLMKVLDLDSSLTARKELAKELNYSGDTNSSAAMNIWLHKEVMRKLAENGGKVPNDLRV
jgi:Domain of unknown function (DUF3597)